MKDSHRTITGILESSLDSSGFRGSFEVENVTSDEKSGNWQAELSGDKRRVRITCDRGQVFLSVSYLSGGTGWMDLMHMNAMLRQEHERESTWEYPKPQGPSDQEYLVEELTKLFDLFERSINTIDKYVEEVGADLALSNYRTFAEGRMQSRLREKSDMEPGH